MYIPSLVFALFCLISRRLSRTLWCLLTYEVFVPQGGGGKKQTASAETPTWWHQVEASICKYF